MQKDLAEQRMRKVQPLLNESEAPQAATNRPGERRSNAVLVNEPGATPGGLRLLAIMPKLRDASCTDARVRVYNAVMPLSLDPDPPPLTIMITAAILLDIDCRL